MNERIVLGIRSTPKPFHGQSIFAVLKGARMKINHACMGCGVEWIIRLFLIKNSFHSWNYIIIHHSFAFHYTGAECEPPKLLWFNVLTNQMERKNVGARGSWQWPEAFAFMLCRSMAIDWEFMTRVTFYRAYFIRDKAPWHRPGRACRHEAAPVSTITQSDYRFLILRTKVASLNM